MKYSNLKLEDERIALMGEHDAQRHRAANVLQTCTRVFKASMSILTMGVFTSQTGKNYFV